MIDIPKKITPCPIIESLVEIKFQSTVEPEAVFGMIYSIFRDSYPEVVKLPILQLPQEIRAKDNNLKYSPYYRLKVTKESNHCISIGPRVVNVSQAGEYVGWHDFSKQTEDILTKIISLKIFGQIERYSLRYINFFDFNIFDKIVIEIKKDDCSLIGKNTFLRTELEGNNNFINILQISNKVELAQPNKEFRGSVIDIESTIVSKYINIESEIGSILENSHTEEKYLFFGLLQKDFIDSLNPEY